MHCEPDTTARQTAEHEAQIPKLYQLLATPILGPITQETIAVLSDVPFARDLLEAAFPHSRGSQLVDDLACEHYRLFGLQVLPYAGCFLSGIKIGGADIATEISALGNRTGCSLPILESERPDHLGVILLLLSMAPQSLQTELLGRFLLPWLGPLTVAIEQQKSPFYSELMAILRQALVLHWTGLPRMMTESFDRGPFARTDLDVGSQLLADPATDLEAISEFLLLTARSGVYFSQSAIGDLARTSGVPIGVGDRLTLLKDLFFGGAQYDRSENVLAAVSEYVMEWQRGLHAMAGSLHPGTIDPWLHRCAGTTRLLETMCGKLHSRSHRPSPAID